MIIKIGRYRILLGISKQKCYKKIKEASKYRRKGERIFITAKGEFYIYTPKRLW